MKIYKLDIDTSKPIRKVVQMQQNSTGALSVDVKRNDWPIRNLSCALYDGGNEISSCLSGESGAGFKLDVGEDAKVVKLVAQSTPIECSAEYIASYPSGNRTRTVTLKICNIPAGEYKQEEFYNLVENLHTISSDAGVVTEYYGMPCMVNGNQLSNTNFNRFYVYSDRFPPV